jgi:hypothetical protein
MLLLSIDFVFRKKHIQYRQKQYYYHGPQHQAVKTKGRHTAKDRHKNDQRVELYPVLEEYGA